MKKPKRKKKPAKRKKRMPKLMFPEYTKAMIQGGYTRWGA